MLPPAKLRRLTRGRHIFHESLDPYKQDGPKKHQKNQLHLYRWINPRVKPMWIRPFCWGFHITSLFIPIDGSSPWCGWMQAEVLSESPEVWMGPSRSGWTVKTNKKSNEEKLIQESGTNVINYIWHLICILYRIPPPKKKSAVFCWPSFVFCCCWLLLDDFIWEDHRCSPQGVAGEPRRCQVESEANGAAHESSAASRMGFHGDFFGNHGIKQGEICWIFHGKHVTVVPFVGWQICHVIIMVFFCLKWWKCFFLSMCYGMINLSTLIVENGILQDELQIFPKG